ncbi:MAG: hypothetical protein JXQ73_25150 [Phycisphaerae bacterium]|nr:hypothetical protein [Phycisphaerae bacterium]
MLIGLAAIVVAYSADAPPTFHQIDFSGQMTYVVSAVSDPRTITVESDGTVQKVRLAGLRAPGPGQSPSYLTSLLSGESVYMFPATEEDERRTDSALCRYVYRVPDGLFINAELIRQGHGLVDDTRHFYDDQFHKLEAFARSRRTGQWRIAANIAKPPTTSAPADARSGISSEVKAEGFRGIPWGATKEAVESQEKAPRIRDLGDILVYSDRVAGLPAQVGYVFADGKLVIGKYRFTVEHVNGNAFLDDFDKIHILLEKKYGKAKTCESFWRRDLYRSDATRWGMAIAVGDLSRYAVWELADTTLCLALSGDNFEISLVLEYSSRAHEALYRDSLTRTNSDGL